MVSLLAQLIQNVVQVHSSPIRSAGLPGVHLLLILNIFLQVAWTDFGAINVAVAVHGDAFGDASTALGFGVRNERSDLSVFEAAGANTAVNTGVVAISTGFLGLGLRVGDIENISRSDEDPAGTAELFQQSLHRELPIFPPLDPGSRQLWQLSC